MISWVLRILMRVYRSALKTQSPEGTNFSGKRDYPSLVLLDYVNAVALAGPGEKRRREGSPGKGRGEIIGKPEG